MEFPIRRQ